MLFERTCRIKQDFDWFLRFVPPNSVEKRKISKNHPETCTKTGSTILSSACLGMFEPSKTFFMFLFVMPANQKCQHCTIAIKMRKISKHHPENGIKTGSTILSPACLGIFEPSKTFFMFLFVIPANQKCQRCTIAIEKQKSARIIQKPAQKNRQHDSFVCLFGDV